MTGTALALWDLRVALWDALSPALSDAGVPLADDGAKASYPYATMDAMNASDDSADGAGAALKLVRVDVWAEMAQGGGRAVAVAADAAAAAADEADDLTLASGKEALYMGAPSTSLVKDYAPSGPPLWHGTITFRYRI